MTWYKYFLIACCCSAPFASFADIHYSSVTYTINVDIAGRGFKTDYSAMGDVSKKSETISIYYDELTELKSYDFYYTNHQQKVMRVGKSSTITSKIGDASFYSGITRVAVPIPFDKGRKESIEFEHLYSERCKELMNLCQLNFEPYINTDTLTYHLFIPKEYKLILTTVDLQRITNIEIDSTSSPLGVTYHLSRTNIKYKKEIATHSPFIQQDFIPAIVRLIIIPANWNKSASAYFNKWYLDLISVNDPESNLKIKALCDSLLSIKVPDDSIPVIFFNYVKNKIRYIAIENGINAYKPRVPKEIINNKKGDCKDMAYMLCKMLRYKGFEAYVSLVPSVTYTFADYFPSISSFNHAICMYKQKENWIALDATDNTCPFPLPSRHIQSRTIFIVDSSGGQTVVIPHVSATNNPVTYKISIRVDDAKIDGDFVYTYREHSASNIKQGMLNQAQKYIEHSVTSYLESQSDALTYDSLDYQFDDHQLVLKGKVNLTGSAISASDDKVFIGLKFLPRPLDYMNTLNESEKLFCYEAINRTMEADIIFSEDVKLESPVAINFEKGGMIFKCSAKQTNKKKINISYKIFYDQIIVDKNQISIYNELITIISNTLDHVLIIQ
jgi:hypothetical protein